MGEHDCWTVCNSRNGLFCVGGLYFVIWLLAVSVKSYGSSPCETTIRPAVTLSATPPYTCKVVWLMMIGIIKEKQLVFFNDLISLSPIWLGNSRHTVSYFKTVDIWRLPPFIVLLLLRVFAGLHSMITIIFATDPVCVCVCVWIVFSTGSILLYHEIIDWIEVLCCICTTENTLLYMYYREIFFVPWSIGK